MAGLIDVVVSLGAALVVSWLAYRRGALSTDGLIAATVAGATVVVAGGWAWGAILIAFFVSSSVLSLLREKRRPGETITARGRRRDAVQVIANGGIAMLAAVFAPLTDHPAAFGVFAGTVAAATADTWATEIGGLAGKSPRLITTGQPVAPGTSGGISIAGSLGSIAGASLIGALAALAVGLGWIDTSASILWVFLAGLAGGVFGSLGDSLLGATVQLQYVCLRCHETTERRVHCRGATTRRLRGINWITNDTVNAAATLAGGVISAAIVTL
ncbi:MAG: DUF92 domain-containing protein [Thermomicrobiales bacterium]